jgi:predicted nucleic acid-binding protein
VIVILDASAAVKIVLQQKPIKPLLDVLKDADWVIAPDIYISEVSNVYWKYHQFEDLPMNLCEESLKRTIGLIDDFIDTSDLYQEAFSFSCQVNHPVYDSMYLICARRYNGIFLSADKKLNTLAQKHSLNIAGK